MGKSFIQNSLKHKLSVFYFYIGNTFFEFNIFTIIMCVNINIVTKIKKDRF